MTKVYILSSFLTSVTVAKMNLLLWSIVVSNLNVCCEDIKSAL